MSQRRPKLNTKKNRNNFSNSDNTPSVPGKPNKDKIKEKNSIKIDTTADNYDYHEYREYLTRKEEEQERIRQMYIIPYKLRKHW